MCGLAGTIVSRSRDPQGLQRAVEAMSAALRHRGPDDSGSWVDHGGRCALGFRRLSILDLSPNGHQPMSSPSGRFALVFNGEVYNHLEIRKELLASGYSFRGHSDTETLCAAMERWGVSGTAQRCIGMFAMAVWDNDAQSIALVRDRVGIKPLYLYRSGGLALFGSELKALKAHPEFRPELSQDALQMYLRYLYIPAPATIFREVSKVMPGHVTTISASTLEVNSEPYWSVADVYANAQLHPYRGSDQDAVDELEALLSDAVRLRKLADVPVGALLSGGIDSTTVVALMQRDAVLPARTFSIGFTASEHDESRHAARVADFLGTDHTAIRLDGRDALNVVPMLPRMFDEPLADPSAIPTYLVCQLARQDVTVALTGDGGDELFAGYHRYISGQRIIGSLKRVPATIRKSASWGLHRLSQEWYPLVAPVAQLSGQRLIREKLGKLGRMSAMATSNEMYRSLLSVGWQAAGPDKPMRCTGADVVEGVLSETTAMPLLDQMMLADQRTYLPDDLLAKVDRASMAVSLEARVPILDHRVVEFAWRLPANMKIRNQQGKWLLRQVLYKHVPRELVDRPKVGFSVPIADWLRGPLSGWAEDHMSGFPEPVSSAAVLTQWQRFKRGETDSALDLWALCLLQAWRKEWNY
jgi:asparagine synthase (glutamine-hydrolysing)